MVSETTDELENCELSDSDDARFLNCGATDDGCGDGGGDSDETDKEDVDNNDEESTDDSTVGGGGGVGLRAAAGAFGAA